MQPLPPTAESTCHSPEDEIAEYTNGIEQLMTHFKGEQDTINLCFKHIINNAKSEDPDNTSETRLLVKEAINFINTIASSEKKILTDFLNKITIVPEENRTDLIRSILEESTINRTNFFKKINKGLGEIIDDNTAKIHELINNKSKNILHFPFQKSA